MLILYFLTPPCFLPRCVCVLQEVAPANRLPSRWLQRWRRKWWPWTMRRPLATSIKPYHPPHSRTLLWSWLKTTSARSSPTHQRQFIHLSQQEQMALNHFLNHSYLFFVWLSTIMERPDERSPKCENDYHKHWMFECVQAHFHRRRTQASSSTSQKEPGLQEPSAGPGCPQWHQAGLHRTEA